MATREHKLVRAFVELSNGLVTGSDAAEMMYTLVERCIDILDVAAAGLMLADQDGKLRLIAHSGPGAELIEMLESHTEEGPCFDAYRTGEAVISADLEADRARWPRVVEACLRAGYRAAIGVPLSLRDQMVGAMNLFRDREGRLDEPDYSAARAMADIATAAVLNARALSDAQLIAQQLQGALDSRVVIEQAKGVLAATSELGMDEAFRLLRRHARDHGRNLHAVAGDVIDGKLTASTLSSGTGRT